MLDYPLPQNQYQPEEPKSRLKRIIFLIVLVILVAGTVYLGGIKRTIAVINPVNYWPLRAVISIMEDPNYLMPAQNNDRINVLILGIRGEDDPDASDGGPLLTDSIQIFSYDKLSKKSALISIPRDLYVTIHDDKKDKLNTAYEYGLGHTGDSLKFVKERMSRISGVYIDKVVVFNFSSFKEIIDSLGGVDVTLDKPFSENQQWGNAFSLPAGVNHLDGQSALYYARSRYSSSDFDRSRRQQQIIFALKDKLLKMDFFSDPVKTFSILNLIRNDTRTDISIWDTKQYIDLAHSINLATMKRNIISTDNLLVEGRGPGNAYILLPKTGDLTQIKQLFRDALK